jgi:hypothetical protein
MTTERRNAFWKQGKALVAAQWREENRGEFPRAVSGANTSECGRAKPFAMLSSRQRSLAAFCPSRLGRNSGTEIRDF